MTTETQPATGISRRRIAQGAAWSLPVLAVSSAAPAMAASPCDPLTYSFGVVANDPTAPSEAGAGPDATYLLSSERELDVFSATFTNLSLTDDIDVGVDGISATVQLMAPWYVDNVTVVGFLWESLTVLSVSPGYTLTPLPIDSWVTVDNASWYGYNFAVNEAIPAGSSFTVTWKLTAFEDGVPTDLARTTDGVPGDTTDYRTLSGAKLTVVNCGGAVLDQESLTSGFWLRTPPVV